jgi:replicative DNA helicase
MEKELIRLLLNKEFYNKNKRKLTKEFFTNGTGDLYETIRRAHEDSEKDLSINEVSTLHMEVYNPASTRAKRENFDTLVGEIKQLELPNEKIANNIIRSLFKRRIAQNIAQLASNIYNGQETDFSEIKKQLDTSFEDDDGDEYEYVTDNINNLIEKLKDNTKWKFNLAPLKEAVNGIGEGNLVIVFARPEAGKTAFWVNLVAGIDGFAAQGAKVCALINEEPAIRTQMRLINAHTGLTMDEIRADIQEANKKWAEVRQNIHILDTVDWSLDDVDDFVQKEKPDILVIDQLDKVGVTGNFARTDEKLRAIYTGAREVAKRNDCCVIAVSQASADGQGKFDLTFDMMEGSKTGKAAEADVIIGVGHRDKMDTDERVRSLAISKNKITGWHGLKNCIIIPELSRYAE